MRIDSHQHFWAYDPEQYAWIGEGMEVLAQDHLPADLKPHLDEHGLDGSVLVQVRQTVEETRWMLGLADEHPFIKGVVGWVDLRSSELEAQLDELCAHERLVGIRHVVQDEPDERFLLRDDFQAGVARLAGRGLAESTPNKARRVASSNRHNRSLPLLASPLLRHNLHRRQDA